MDARAQQQALRQQMSLAREALDRGDRLAALQALDAALAVDSQFLAALSLRERVLSGEVVPAARRTSPAPALTSHGSVPLPERRVPDRAPTADPTASARVISPDGWARFENRARVRRLEKRTQAAHDAIARGRFAEAEAAVDEIRSLDREHPELISLGMQLDAAHGPVTVPRRGRFVAGLLGVAAFAAVLLGGTLLDRAPTAPVPSASLTPARPSISAATDAGAVIPAAQQTLARTDETATDVPDPAAQEIPPRVTDEANVVSPIDRNVERPVQAEAPAATDRRTDADLTRQSSRAWPFPATALGEPLAPPSTPAAAAHDADDAASGPVGFSQTASSPAPSSSAAPLPAAASGSALTTTVAPAAPLPTAADASADPPPVAPSLAAPPPVSAGNASASAPMREDELVREVLRRYRLAYDSLDARSARAVWPAVDETALQRAFDGLQSQHLTFSDCSVDVRDAVSSAVCRGSTQYVTKIGSRVLRVEPRVWNFRLRKIAGEWVIESARADR